MIAPVVQLLCRFRDGRGVEIVGRSDGRYIESQSRRERVGLEGSRGRIARTVFKAGSQSQRPCFMEPAMQYSEGRVIVAGDGDQAAVRAGYRIEPNEKAVLGDTRRSNIALQTNERVPHFGSRSFVPPPLAPGRPALEAFRLNLCDRVLERLLVECSFLLRHVPTKVEYPLVRGPSGDIHAVPPRLEYVCVRPAVGVGG